MTRPDRSTFGDPRVDAGRFPSEDTAGADEIVEAWLADLSDRGGADRPEDLLAAYRSLGLAVIRRGVADAGDTTVSREFGRALGRVASAIRRSGLRISEALDDLDRLGPATVAWLRRQSGAGDRELEILRWTGDLARSLDAAVRRIVRILEERALRAERERSEALAAMTDQLSHELSNRLGAARTASQMLLNAEIELDQRGLERVAELVDASVDAALDTVGDVRSLHHGLSGPDDSRSRATRLPRLIRAIIEDLSPTALDAGVSVGVDGDVVECEVDAARLRLIVFNLVGNGIKYRDPDDNPSVVRIRTRGRRDGKVELEVADNGIGIADDDLEDIFLDHVRGSETGHVAGSGVGLAIVKEAIEQIGGTIDVRSELGVGTTFTVRFHPLVGP